MAHLFNTNDYINFGDNDMMDAATELTLVTDVYVSSLVGDHAMLSKEASASNRSLIFFYDAAGIGGNERFAAFIQTTSAADRVETTDTIVVDTWYRVFCRWSKNTTDGLYIKVMDFNSGQITKYTDQAPATTTNANMKTVTSAVRAGDPALGGRDMAGGLSNLFLITEVLDPSLDDAMIRSGNYQRFFKKRAEIYAPLNDYNGTYVENFGTAPAGIISNTDAVAGPASARFGPSHRTRWSFKAPAAAGGSEGAAMYHHLQSIGAYA